MTRADHLSGSDRAAEVASADTAAYIVNIQGDEPLIDPAAIDAAVLGLVNEAEAPMSTLAKRIQNPREIEDPNAVKVVTDLRGYALYFSRCPIPFARGDRPPYRKHIGLVRLPAGVPAGLFATCRWARWSGRRSWNSCARWKTATPFGWSKPSTNH